MSHNPCNIPLLFTKHKILADELNNSESELFVEENA